MGGLLSSSMPMTIFKTNSPGHLDMEGLRKGAFTEAIDTDGVRSGWVGLGNLLDTENFILAGNDNRFSGFSFRTDSRKIPSSVVKLQLAEKIKQEEAQGGKVGAKRKKELREEIINRLSANADFVPSLTDCLWDAEKGVLMIASASDKIINRILKNFEGSFHKTPERLASDKEMSGIFNEIHHNNGKRLSAYSVSPLGTASMAGLDENSEASSIKVLNNPQAVSEALGRGFTINKMSMAATDNNNEENQIFFCVDDKLQVNSVHFPKKDKSADEDAVFLINAQICADTAQMLEDLIEA